MCLHGSLAAQSGHYTQEISGTDLTIEMVAIPGGTFIMGSPELEVGRKTDEGPQRKVQLAPFWMSQYEITWDLYNLYVNRNIDDVAQTQEAKEIIWDIDAIAGATKPYVDMSLGMGTKGLPVVNITQLAASKFCEWLSAKTGLFYRLPTEAEWEYACRAGTTSAYHFGDDASLLDNYAWYADNSDFTYYKGGLKKPNPWGLFDMHGNVAEWTLDQYHSEGYPSDGEIHNNPLVRTKKRYPVAVRGGSWDDEKEALRSAARTASSEEWILRDPQLPKSKWWNTDAAFVGFRIVRANPPENLVELQKYWIQEN
ncbi:formylglycine-generating enzyme family protein [Arenibacter sp. GZD96]|uniref:formylglycine-generating enzyme family protein n=1 Tax=Aurantibrevibacter litoralis TaxID=3106030 RepID=UPI002AFF1601|nr:formylglycine-generating enzyme family protein [Arenibacter sp. GZD-96]MEA1784802.1 formylglycine-generating enzyme family protein [Arenibacter sp. GZD-96]